MLRQVCSPFTPSCGHLKTSSLLAVQSELWEVLNCYRQLKHLLTGLILSSLTCYAEIDLAKPLFLKSIKIYLNFLLPERDQKML